MLPSIKRSGKLRMYLNSCRDVFLNPLPLPSGLIKSRVATQIKMKPLTHDDIMRRKCGLCLGNNKLRPISVTNLERIKQ